MTSQFSPARLEAFSDGVIAVIITIMVLELKVPVTTGVGAFDSEVASTLGVYAMSFMYIGVYWINHHSLIGRLRQSNNRILWANLAWLFALSLIPFFTEYIDKHFDTFAVTIYCACMLLAGATFLLLRYTVDCQLRREGRATQLDFSTRMKHIGSLLINASSIGVARFAPHIALCITGIVTFMWIVPTLGLFGGSYGGDASHHELSPQPATHNADTR